MKRWVAVALVEQVWEDWAEEAALGGGGGEYGDGEVEVDEDTVAAIEEALMDEGLEEEVDSDTVVERVMMAAEKVEVGRTEEWDEERVRRDVEEQAMRGRWHGSTA